MYFRNYLLSSLIIPLNMLTIGTLINITAFLRIGHILRLRAVYAIIVAIENRSGTLKWGWCNASLPESAMWWVSRPFSSYFSIFIWFHKVRREWFTVNTQLSETKLPIESSLFRPNLRVNTGVTMWCRDSSTKSNQWTLGQIGFGKA